MPVNLRGAAERDGRDAWLGTIEATVRALERRWSIEVGRPFQPGGTTAWVAPARPLDGCQGRDQELVLKVGWRHPEADHEPDGLEAWDGRGAVRLHAAHGRDDTIAILIERCRPGTTLADRPETEQDTILAGLLRRLWIEPPPGHPFRPLQQMCDFWADQFEADWAGRPPGLDAGLARLGMELFRSLPGTAGREVLLCTDLHAGNVLAAEREPWLVIDPKPYVGDPTYDPVQHMLNCEERLRHDPVGFLGRLAGLLDLDRDRLRLWLFARCVQESPGWPGLDEIARRVAP